jgi:hypothetical protein
VDDVLIPHLPHRRLMGSSHQALSFTFHYIMRMKEDVAFQATFFMEVWKMIGGMVGGFFAGVLITVFFLALCVAGGDDDDDRGG